MLLVSAVVGPFKSIYKPQIVAIDEDVTVLVGMNEAGKTVFLRALEKSADALESAAFDPVDDYPRKDLSTYLKAHGASPAQVTQLTYRLTDDEIAELNEKLHTKLPPGFEFSVSHYYNNSLTVALDVEELPAIEALLGASELSSDAKAALQQVTTIRAIPTAMKEVSLTKEDQAFLAALQNRIGEAKADSVVRWEVRKWLASRIPKFVYFGEYELLPSKLNLADLARRVEQAKSDPRHLEPKHLATLALLRMADISVSDFTSPGGYEPLKAKIEGVSISLTDQIMEFWKQNEELEVEIDIKPDADDDPPFNNGPNIYIRIRDRRHRGVTTPFRHRSRGFIWFFSFLVWFDRVQQQLGKVSAGGDRDVILLLDEPGLSLHALAQADFLRYIDDLSKKHQVLYTTHSPFMIHSERLHQVRVVEDRPKVGTVISDTVSGSDPRTIFPLQAALGWTIAQNLFISERNLLVEGPSDLVYLKVMSAALEARGRTGLRDDVTIVPTGGLDKVVTFVALLGANGLKLAVFHDYRGVPDQKLMDLVRQKMISPKAVMNASQFRDPTNIGKDGRPSDTEDLLPVGLYLDHFNQVFAQQLGGTRIAEGDLPIGDRIIERIERLLSERKIQLRPSGGFNHYLVASHFASSPPTTVEATVLDRFELLFNSVNALF